MVSGMKTSTRLLRLLSLLQGRRDWSGPQLAEELDVTTRTVRNDVERIRQLGYPVNASPGVAGGYRLGAGSELPPLLLDQREAIAVAVGLRAAAAGAVAGVESVALAALAKLEQVMPARVRRRVRNLQQAMVTTPWPATAPDPDTLSAIAAACAEHDRLRFGYRSHDGATTTRATEPHRLVHDGRRWYLVAWDNDRSDWRTFRVDRIAPDPIAGPRFVPRPPPAADVVRHLVRGVQQATWRARARVKVHMPASELSKRLPAAVTVEAAGDNACIASVGADSLSVLAPYLGMLGADFEVIDPPALRAELRALARRYLRAAAAKPS
jgi:predicted DNA-binding transcriptional regulator YafY